MLGTGDDTWESLGAEITGSRGVGDESSVQILWERRRRTVGVAVESGDSGWG